MSSNTSLKLNLKHEFKFELKTEFLLDGSCDHM